MHLQILSVKWLRYFHSELTFWIGVYKFYLIKIELTADNCIN